MSAEIQTAILLEHCKALRMPGLAKSYEGLACTDGIRSLNPIDSGQ